MSDADSLTWIGLGSRRVPSLCQCNLFRPAVDTGKVSKGVTSIVFDTRIVGNEQLPRVVTSGSDLSCDDLGVSGGEVFVTEIRRR
jgi:hypothetical protein